MNQREELHKEETRVKFENLAKECEEYARIEEMNRRIIIEKEEEFDETKIKYPNLLNQDKRETIRSILDLY